MAQMTQKQVEDWIAANGGQGVVQYGVEQKQVRNPNPDIVEQTLHPYVPVEVEVWKNAKTGAALTVQRKDDGNFEQIESVGADPNKPAASNDGPPGGKPYIDEPGPSGRRMGWNPATKSYDRDLGASADAQKPSTEATRAPVQGKPGVFQVTTKNAQTGVTETHFEDASGNTVPTPTDPASKTRVPVQGKPGVYTVTTKDPQTGVTETHFEDDAGNTVPTPSANPEQTRTTITRNGKTYVQVSTKKPDGTASLSFEDQAGNAVQLPDEEKPGSYQPLPDGVPKFLPDLTSLDLGLGERRRALDALVNSGTITKEQAAATIKADAEDAVTAARNAGAIVNIQEGNRTADSTARGQEITDASSRRQFASSTFNQALSTLAPIGSSFIPGAGSAEAAAAGFRAMLGLANSNAREVGGLNPLTPYDPTKYPMLNQFGQAGLPGAPGGGPISDRWSFGPGGALQPPAGPSAAAPAVNPAASELATPSELAAAAAPAPAAPLPPPVFTPQPPAPAPTTTIAPDGTVTMQHTAPATAAAAPGPAQSLFSQMAGGGQPMPQYDPLEDGLHEDMAAAGFRPDAITDALMPKPAVMGGLG